MLHHALRVCMYTCMDGEASMPDMQSWYYANYACMRLTKGTNISI